MQTLGDRLEIQPDCFFFKVDLRDLDLRTPLHFAAEEGRILAVSFLISIAADPDLQDRWGQTPLDLALKRNTEHHMYVLRKRFSIEINS